MVPVLFDTDIGSNVDDALALAYLLRQPRCELLGITTVSGDVQRRAACAEVVCRAAGRDDILIHCGSPGPLLLGPGLPDVPLYNSISHRKHRLDRPVGTAVEFLRSTVRNSPGEVTLLTTGPLTNVALLFAMDPEVPSLLKAVVSMAGIYFPHDKPVETNVGADPVAAAMVFKATADARSAPHTLVGLNATSRCVMPADELRRKLRPPAPTPADVVLEMLDVWARNRRQVTFHDPLAAVLVFEPEVCTYEVGLAVAGIGQRCDDIGRTIFGPARVAPGRTFNHGVAKGVKVRAFFEAYFGTVAGGRFVEGSIVGDAAPQRRRRLPPPPARL